MKNNGMNQLLLMYLVLRMIGGKKIADAFLIVTFEKIYQKLNEGVSMT